MPAKLNLMGQTFGRLTVVGEAGRIGRRRYVKCSCVCGAMTVARAHSVKSGEVASCGCGQRDAVRATGHKNGRHRKSHSRVYRSWEAMIRRTTKTSDAFYELYGGRGISVCERWRLFDNFYADMGDPPEGTTIDRIDNNAGYSPENCRWATAAQQSQNRRPYSEWRKAGERNVRR